MEGKSRGRRPRKGSLPSYALLCICIVMSALVVAWSVMVKLPLNDLQLKFHVYSIWRGYTGPANHTIESVDIGLNLTVSNLSGSDSPPILFEEPSVLLNGWKLDIQRIICLNATAETARLVDGQPISYITLCDSTQPIILKPNQSVFLPLRVTIYNNTDKLPNAFWTPQSGSFNATLSGYLTVRPFYDPSVPAPQTQAWGQAFWASREFNMTATFTG